MEELKLDLHKLEELKHFEFKESSEVILGSIVKVQMDQGTRLYFVSPSFGGVHLKLGQDLIYVVTVISPIGEAMMGLSEGDEFELDSEKIYSVLTIN